MRALSIVVLVAAVACAHAGVFHAAPLVYSYPSHTVHGLSLPHPINYAAPSFIQYSPAIAKVAYAAPVVYSAPVVKHIAPLPLVAAAPVHVKSHFLL